MNVIYEPKGKAREYSPLALNIFNGCDHGCTYCYCRRIMGEQFGDKPAVRKELRKRLSEDLDKHEITEQVLLCFAGDPYCHANVFLEETRHVLIMLLQHNVPTAILTKGGKRCLADLDRFRQFKPGMLKVGMSLSWTDGIRAKEWEPGAAPPKDRMEALRTLHDNGIRTWVSIEPVIDPMEAMQVIQETNAYVDEYRIGMLNHYVNEPIYAKQAFIGEAVHWFRMKGKDFYLKKGFQQYADGLTPEEKDPDHLALKREAVQTDMFGEG